MVTSHIEIQLRRLLDNTLPAINSARCRFSRMQGLTGDSWHIEGEHVQLLARQQTMRNRMLGVNRRREGQVIKRTGRDIGPLVRLQHPEWLIVEWLEGEKVGDEAFAALNASGALGSFTAQLHKRKCSGYRFDLQKQLAHYWQHVDDQRRTPAWLRWQRYFMRHKMPNPLMLAPLHMDIHAGNLLLQGDRLRLIDWEYAADGDIALELAMLFRFNQFPLKIQQHFLNHYVGCGYRDLPRLAAQVRRWLPWVDYLMLMWFEVRWQQCRDPVFLCWSAPLYQRFCLSSPSSQ